MKELKPCPFCGGEAKYFRSDFDDDVEDTEYVGCTRCEAVTPLFFKKDQSIEWWNRRPNPWHTGTPTESGNYLVFYWDDHNPMCMDIPHLYNGILGFNAESSEWIDEDGMVAFDNEEICLWQKIDMPSDEFLASLQG